MIRTLKFCKVYALKPSPSHTHIVCKFDNRNKTGIYSHILNGSHSTSECIKKNKLKNKFKSNNHGQQYQGLCCRNECNMPFLWK